MHTTSDPPPPAHSSPSCAQPQFSQKEKLQILDRVAWSEMFETFLANKYSSAKRFGLEGGETLVPGMKILIDRAADLGVESVVIGMPHRGETGAGRAKAREGWGEPVVVGTPHGGKGSPHPLCAGRLNGQASVICASRCSSLPVSPPAYHPPSQVASTCWPMWCASRCARSSASSAASPQRWEKAQAKGSVPLRADSARGGGGCLPPGSVV